MSDSLQIYNNLFIYCNWVVTRWQCQCGEFLDQLRNCQLLRKDSVVQRQLVSQCHKPCPLYPQPVCASDNVNINIHTNNIDLNYVDINGTQSVLWPVIALHSVSTKDNLTPRYEAPSALGHTVGSGPLFTAPM